MQFLTLLSAVSLSTLSLALPAPNTSPNLQGRQASVVCSGTYGTPQCCATNVLDVADLNCANPPTIPTDTQSFIDECAAIGQQAQCCALPILDQALLCEAPL